LNPVDDIARLAHQAGGLVFCDITQSLGKQALDLRALDADLAAASAPQVRRPSRRGPALQAPCAAPGAPAVLAAAREQGLRPGTENLPGIVGMGAALDASLSGLSRQSADWAEAREHLALGLKRVWPAALIHGGEAVLSNTLSVSFLGVEKDTLLLKLDQLGLEASAGSACAAALPNRPMCSPPWAWERRP